jgi:hypothetical protein
MSSTRNLTDEINELLNQIIPSELLAATYIGQIEVDAKNQHFYIRYIKNTSVANILYEQLSLDNYPAILHQPITTRFGIIVICCGHPTRFADTLSALSIEEKTALSTKIADAVIAGASLRATEKLNKLTDGLKRHGIDNPGIELEIRKMHDSLKNPPKNLQDVITLNDKLSGIADKYDKAKEDKNNAAALINSFNTYMN